MKTLMIIAALLFSVPAFGADVHVKWDASPGATGYKLYSSDDLGVTWTDGIDVGPETDHVITDVPDTGIILFRASAYNANGEAVRYDSGVWHCGDCIPPKQPTGIGVE